MENKVIEVDAFTAKCKTRELKQIAARVAAIKALFADDCSAEMMEALALYVGALEPRKIKVFTDTWDEVMAPKSPLGAPEPKDEGNDAPEGNDA